MCMCVCVCVCVFVCVYKYLCVCVYLKGEGFMCVWMRERGYAYLCASLCVNDISVTMYFGKSEPNFMVQRCNSVIPFAAGLFVTPMIFSSFTHVDICVIEIDIWRSQLLYSLAKLYCPIVCLAHVMFCNFVGC